MTEEKKEKMERPQSNINNTINLCLPDFLVEQVDEIASEKGLSRSRTIEDIIDEYMEQRKKMFEAFYELSQIPELSEEDYEDKWSHYRFTLIREILDKVNGDKLSDKNRMRYYKISEAIFKSLQERMKEKR